MSDSDLSTRHVRILLVLADGARHGYAVSKQIEDDTDGRVSLRPGSLYRALHQLRERDLIRERHDRGEDPRRRSYELTPEGWKALSAELARMRGLVDRGRALGVPGAAVGRG